ncbi:MAG: hypothetical protein COX19_03345 [Desulfobacterales bacterium CG23_combo_of_CG06-09_8_20_14_all_51_8]|nr:MAG: hypothetical protein COX19_03345 [Desulfobacterales bacterium CG23_combo_of_CG06-09_8_20_14_all_51_8]
MALCPSEWGSPFPLSSLAPSRHSGAGRKRPPVIPAQAGNQKGFIEILNSGYRVGVRHDGKDVEHFYTGYRIKSGMTRMDRGPV